MKANKIILKRDYNAALISKETSQFQNVNRFYSFFGECGLSIIDAKTEGEKVVNDWRNKSYAECCSLLDETPFEL